MTVSNISPGAAPRGADIADQDPFLSAMLDRRRTRIAGGAYHPISEAAIGEKLQRRRDPSTPCDAVTLWRRESHQRSAAVRPIPVQ